MARGKPQDFTSSKHVNDTREEQAYTLPYLSVRTMKETIACHR